MKKEEIIQEIKDTYWDDVRQHRDAGKELAEQVGQLYNLPKDSVEYFKLKSEIFGEIGMNGMEQLERGKMGQGMLTRRVFEHLFFGLIELERTK